MPILGYKKTGFLQIIEPAVLDKSRSVAQAKREELKLKFS